METMMKLNDAELEMVNGGVKPNNVGKNVGQYDIKKGKEYYLHYTEGGHDQWIRIKILDVYEADNGYFLWHHCTKRTADYVICSTGKKLTTPVNKKNLIYEIR